jgi:hypothetical protein
MEELATSGTFPWSILRQIVHIWQASHGGTRKTLGSVASLIAEILYQGNPDGNHKL